MKGICALAVSLVLGAGLAAPLAGGTADEEEIAAAIRARLDAYRQGDASRWASFVDDDCLCAAETKAEILRAIANRPPAVKSWYGEPTALEARFYGEVAVVRYRVTENTELDGRVNRLAQWRTETHLRRAGKWVLVAAAENLIAADPEPAVVAPEVLARYVGRYEYTPGSVDTVTLEGERLFVQPTGEARVELFPEDATTFFAQGEPWRLVFRASPEGVVDSVVFRQHGQEYVAKRLP